MKTAGWIITLTLFSAASYAKVDLATLPTRETVQLTIYNSADLTLARESRALTLRNGVNRLQFSWANTLIDPTSLALLPKANADKIDVMGLVYPPRARDLGIWNIQSVISGKVPVEITYFTSGLSWRAFYMGTLTRDEKTMGLQGYVRVVNNSGEDYEDAQTRLIVGKVHILDRIAELARRKYPYGRPGPVSEEFEAEDELFESKREAGLLLSRAVAAPCLDRLKEIKKEGLSEYFLYTIEGTETIPHGWAKRLPSFQAGEVPVLNLYKFEQERYGSAVVRFLSFKNDKEHKLGDTPIPGGALRVYRTADAVGLLSYVGRSSFKYIPVDEDVELNLGAVANVVVEPKLMDFKTDRYVFDRKSNISGWEEIKEFKIEAKNTRDVPVKVEIKRNFGTPYWELEKSGDCGEYEKVDLDTIKFTLTLSARSKREFTYTITTRHGTRE